ncbi:G-alpha-domain-containing protein [Pholiota conissans]|uniref:G-alpha-domain-containing protein n=1 Tax=Pholiota conissans TaxID=109636 RepID=A0A9P6CNM6_9AGAR|nr:G-alpha-domain-containing protein [Pholiota conissans]
MGSPDAQDPFAVFHRPPPNETPGERAEREAREIAARKVSERIDDELRAEKARMKRERVVRVLLLGQSESGKSTTLKNFRLRYARAAWDAERLAWRSVIQLNVVRSLRSVLESVQAEVDGASTDDAEPLTPTASTPTFPPDSTPSESELSSPAPDSAAPSTPAPHTPGLTQSSPSRHLLSLSISTKHSGTLTEKQSQALTDIYTDLRQRLEGLEEIERVLMHRLGTSSEENYGDGDNTHAHIDAEVDTSIVNRSTILNVLDPNAPGPSTAISLEPRTKSKRGVVQRLQDALVRSAWPTPSPPPVSRSRLGKSLMGSSKPEIVLTTATDTANGVEEEDKPTKWLAEHRQAAKALWADEAVRAVLKKRKVRVEDGAGLFLDDLKRIACLDYTPSDADIVRVQLRTLGVQEYRIHVDRRVSHSLNSGIIGDMGEDWILYDVGGSRTMRHAWVPYFDNIQAIIFLAPISCFDERLSEDSKVNRLEDSFLLFREICSSKLLAKATMVLFLNKCDLLTRKLRSGMQVKNYLPGFGSRPNELATVVKYLGEKFRKVLEEHSPEQREIYVSATSVIDMEVTGTTISAVRDSILRKNLKKKEFI